MLVRFSPDYLTYTVVGNGGATLFAGAGVGIFAGGRWWTTDNGLKLVENSTVEGSSCQWHSPLLSHRQSVLPSCFACPAPQLFNPQFVQAALTRQTQVAQVQTAHATAPSPR